MIFERPEAVYMVGPIAPLANIDGEEVAFADELRRTAPNENLGWLRGHYVEADRPNRNGQVWGSDTLEIASLTPVLMPVTVMHQMNTAVGMIADAKLLTPDAHQVPRARIDTTLGVWKHRFAQVWDEIAANYEQGSLMQARECRPAYYDCLSCGQRDPKLPGNAERANWCSHLKSEEVAAGITRAPRRLGNVTFTGTGLIYGSRGITGALDSAHLEVFQDEVAEFHEQVKRDSNRKPPRRKNRMEIDDSRYAELVAAEQKAKALEPRVTDLEEIASTVPTLTREKEQAEAAKAQAEQERDAERRKREDLEELARAATLASERTSKLGDKFLGKLPDGIKTRLVDEQAKKLSDDEWTARLDELASLIGEQPDAKTEGGSGDNGGSNGNGSGTFSRDEIASTGAGAGTGNGGTGAEPSAAKRRSVIGGLAKATASRR